MCVCVCVCVWAILLFSKSNTHTTCVSRNEIKDMFEKYIQIQIIQLNKFSCVYTHTHTHWICKLCKFCNFHLQRGTSCWHYLDTKVIGNSMSCVCMKSKILLLLPKTGHTSWRWETVATNQVSLLVIIIFLTSKKGGRKREMKNAKVYLLLLKKQKSAKKNTRTKERRRRRKKYSPEWKEPNFASWNEVY